VDIEVATNAGVLSIGFNRPEKRNALTAAMYSAMADGLVRADTDDTIRAVLFHGSEAVFTAGNDLDDFLQRPPSGEDAPVFRFLMAVANARKPLVAAVNGPAVGLGTTLLLHCDLVFAADNARFSLPFTQLGLVPEFASSYLLPLVAGYQRAAELLLLGEPFDAKTAREAGFVTRVLPAAETLPAAQAAAERLAQLPRRSIEVTRALLKSGHRDAIERQLRTEGAHFRAMLGEPAAREALTAFMEKRKPDFTGK
jgi:enoyl-CoA hydratase/carnithine racemase